VRSLTLNRVGINDREKAIATLVSAFISDPVERWLFPGPLDYLTHFPAFVAAFGGRAFERESVWKVNDFAAVAMWMAPGDLPDGDAIISALQGAIPADKHADTFSVLEQMDAAHPAYPHWYLPWLGVDPAHQGVGMGSHLLQQCLRRVDADHCAAFLETPNPRTVSLYERHGFRVTNVSQAGTCPPVTSMLRAAQ
jgi:ribosomal protein S18 acetylase RimI-like enzyme